MILGIAISVVVLLGVLSLASYVERVYAEQGKFLSREFQENVESFEAEVEPRLGVSPERASLSMSVLTQLSTAGIALLFGYILFSAKTGQIFALRITEVIIALVLVVVIFNRLMPNVFFSRTRGDWLIKFVPVLRTLIYLAMPVTLIVSFCVSVAALADEPEEEEPEHPSEAVDALIEAGQEEGILEESDRQLIHSVVQFGDKIVRDVMTPRPQIFAVPADTTIEKFTEMLKEHLHSRVPIYEENIDQTVGVVHTHDVLQISDVDARNQRVRELMRPAMFVPEVKKVNELLREMQREKAHFAIVIDEYGGVSGVVTLEDLVEQIVGNISDEHETVSDVVKDGEHAYIVSGDVDVDRLNELFGFRPQDSEAATIAGLVSEAAKRIPQAGEVIEADGLRYEVLQSTDRRIDRLRIMPAPHPQSTEKVRA